MDGRCSRWRSPSRMSIARCCSTAGRCSRAKSPRRAARRYRAGRRGRRRAEAAAAARRRRRPGRSTGSARAASSTLAELASRARICRASRPDAARSNSRAAARSCCSTAGRSISSRSPRARLDWPRIGAPRLHAALQGDLASPLLRHALKAQGLERLTGTVALEADARGENELRQPDLWRVSAQLTRRRDAARRRSAAGREDRGHGALRRRPVARPGARGHAGSVGRSKSNRAARRARQPRLRDQRRRRRGAAAALVRQAEAASRVNGQLSWTGTAQRSMTASRDAWQISLASTLAGVESRLPEPFAKPAARALPVSAAVARRRRRHP